LIGSVGKSVAELRMSSGVRYKLAVWRAFTPGREQREVSVMSHHVGVWIDHRKAVIVSVSGDQATAQTLESDVGAHPRYSGFQEGGEKKYEERHSEQLDQYYDDVIGRLGQPDALLIFGPGEAKVQLEERFRRSKALSKSTVAIESADKLTDPQIVAKVKEHFGIAR
jgi:hypothetical protein